MNLWRIFTGDKTEPQGRKAFPPPPPWRVPGAVRERVLAATFRPTEPLIDAVNAALYLRRPLLITGKPGSGKSSLIFAVAKELGLGKVLTWPINSRSTLREALYTYDALARLQYIQEQQASGKNTKKGSVDDLGKFLTLGPLGTAVASKEPRALLVDEIDKSDVDLPNDLLNILDTGRFTIPELRRRSQSAMEISDADGQKVEVKNGEVPFSEFPFVVMTSNGERDFPAPFLRRCVQFELAEPTAEELKGIVLAHFTGLREDDPDLQDLKNPQAPEGLLAKFIARRSQLPLSTDQLLNAIHVLRDPQNVFSPEEENRLLDTLFQKLG